MAGDGELPTISRGANMWAAVIGGMASGSSSDPASAQNGNGGRRDRARRFCLLGASMVLTDTPHTKKYRIGQISVRRFAFLAAVAIKGIDGLIETAVGALIAVAGPWSLYTLVVRITAPELDIHPASR